MLFVNLLFGLASAWTIEKGGVTVKSPGSAGERDSFSSLTAPVELYEGTTLDLSFKIGGAPQPHQVFVRIAAVGDDLEDLADPIDKIVPAKTRGANAKAAVSFAELPAELHNYDLAVSALLSNLSGERLEEQLFSLVAYGAEDGKKSSLERVRGTGSTLAAKPEIVHEFQSKPRHVNPVFALVFVSAISGLFLLLLASWRQIWATSERVPESASLVSELLRLGLVAVIEAVFVLYYWKFSIFLAIELVVPPFVVLLVISQYLQTEKK